MTAAVQDVVTFLKRRAKDTMSSILFKCLIKVNRHGILKNNKQIRFNRKTGSRFITSSDSSKMSEAWLLTKLRYEKIKHKLDDALTCDLNAQYTFYFPESIYYTKKGQRSLKLPDLDNLFGLVNDCLQKAQIISNDTIICGFDGSRRKPIKGSEYFLEIILSKLHD
jgi:Holliday junction resolvase RusA-like endonuclease